MIIPPSRVDSGSPDLATMIGWSVAAVAILGITSTRAYPIDCREAFAGLVRGLQRSHGFKTGVALADEAGLTASGLWRIISGGRWPSQSSLAGLSAAFELPDGELYLQSHEILWAKGVRNGRTAVLSYLRTLEEELAERGSPRLRERVFKILNDANDLSLAQAERLASLGFPGGRLKPFIPQPTSVIGIATVVSPRFRTVWRRSLRQAAVARGIPHNTALTVQMGFTNSGHTYPWWNYGVLVTEQHQTRLEELLGWEKGSIMKRYLAAWEEEVDRRLRVAA